MAMKKLRYDKFCEVAEVEPLTMTNENFRNPTAGEYDEDNIKLSHELHYILINLCDGAASSLIRRIGSKYGIATWKTLH